jgi:hypothetical protein
MNDFRNNLAVWFKNNIDFALLLAVLTETPRWAVAFMAVNEPLWVGVPLGVLLAFATSHAWRAYFDTKHRGLFAFNVVSMLIAVAVIAPVLFAMTESQAHEVNISAVLNNETKAVWSTLLALTTFIPLVQLAAVKGLKDASEQPQRQPRTVRTVRRTEQTEQLAVYEQPAEQPVIVDVEQSSDLTAASDEQKRQYLEQLLASDPKPNKTQLAKRLGIGRTTLYAWIDELTPEPIA